MPPRRRKSERGASATSAAASSKKMVNAKSKKNAKPLSLAMSSDEDLLLLLRRFTKYQALFLGFHVIKINDLNLTLNLCFSMFVIRKHQHIHTHCPCHKSLYIISICHGTAPAITVLSYAQVQYIYFMLGSSKHIYPLLRFSLDYAMTLHDMTALNM